MALDASTLSGLMKANIQAIPGINITNEDELEDFTDALAAAVVTHITGAAVVLPGTFTTAAGPVTGAGVVT